jgi:hypothetical protein
VDISTNGVEMMMGMSLAQAQHQQYGQLPSPQQKMHLSNPLVIGQPQMQMVHLEQPPGQMAESMIFAQ